VQHEFFVRRGEAVPRRMALTAERMGIDEVGDHEDGAAHIEEALGL